MIQQIRWLLLITSLAILLPVAAGLFWYIERESGIQTQIHNTLIDLEITHTAITELSQLTLQRISERSLPLREEPLSQKSRHHLRAIMESLNALNSPNCAPPSEELDHMLQRARRHISQISQAPPRLQQEMLDRSLEPLQINLLQIRLLVRELEETSLEVNPKENEALQNIQIPATLGLLLLGIGVSAQMFGEIRNAAYNNARTQRNLTKSREQLNLVFNGTSEMLLLYSLNEKNQLVLEAANQAFRTAFNRWYPTVSMEPVGRTHAEILEAFGISTDLSGWNEEGFRRCLESRRRTEFDTALPTPSETRHLTISIEPIPDPNSPANRLLWVGRDITRRKQIDDELKRFRNTLDQTLDCVFVFGADSLSFFYTNHGAEDQLGYSKSELELLRSVDITPHLNEEQFRALALPLVEGRQSSIQYQTVHRRKDGGDIPVEVALQYVAPQGDEPRFVAIARDRSEHIRVAGALKASEERHALVLKAVNDGVWDWNILTGEAFFSPRWQEILGYRSGEFPERDTAFFERLHSDDKALVESAIQEHFDKKTPFQVEARVRHRDDSYRWILSRGEAQRDDSGRPIRMVGTTTDVTERKRIETQLLQSLHEKETLLREIHHRVKNNMQVISSLLYFQEKKAHDPTSASVFSECRTRLRSMILVHEKLYRAENLSQIRFDDYIRSLIEQIQSTHVGNHYKAPIQPELNPVYLPIELAMPAGMIICELITNIFKYAFPDQRSGEARIRLLTDNDNVRIIISDNGVGLPPEIDTENPTSFGWRLICALRSQLNATTQINRKDGTSVTLTFPAPPQPPPSAPPPPDSSLGHQTQTIATTPATR